jgi:hypothetical protein
MKRMIMVMLLSALTLSVGCLVFPGPILRIAHLHHEGW